MSHPKKNYLNKLETNGCTLENERLEPKNDGLVQMMFLFNCPKDLGPSNGRVASFEGPMILRVGDF